MTSPCPECGLNTATAGPTSNLRARHKIPTGNGYLIPTSSKTVKRVRSWCRGGGRPVVPPAHPKNCGCTCLHREKKP